MTSGVFLVCYLFLEMFFPWTAFFVVFLQSNFYGLIVMAYPSGRDLIFPNSAETTDDLYIATFPDCHNKTFCENPENYPSRLFYNVLQSPFYATRYSQYFQNLKENEQILKTRTEENNEFFICPSTKSIVYPKAAFNVRNEIKFIYNLDDYRQGVSIEVCVRKSKCRFYDKVRSFRTSCKQKFVEKLLLTADEDGRPYIDRYKFPSACVCTYKEHTFSRFAGIYT